jgi:polyphosphate kinase
MENSLPYIHRDVSWLSFNYRVLQEVKDDSVPLLERIKFLAIFSSNLDEFFRVRVANLRNLIRIGKKTKKKLDFDPEEILKQVLSIVSVHQKEFSKLFKTIIIPKLEEEGIRILREKDLNEEQMSFVSLYFEDNLLPFVQPVLLNNRKIRPFLNDAALYLALHLKETEEVDETEKSKVKANSNGSGRKSSYAIVKIPSDHVERYIELPGAIENQHDVILLDDVVRINAKDLFPGYDILDTNSIKITRDAELYIDDEFSGDLLQKIKKSLSKRNVGPASRMVYDRSISNGFLKYLINTFEINPFDLIPEGRYHNNSDLFKFPDFGKNHLKYKILPPLPIQELEEADSIFDKIKKKDWLIHVPYHRYESVVKFFEDAANDPNVTDIKIVQYRVAKRSRIMSALMSAARSGKNVVAFIEVKARFDEEANLDWGNKLAKAGVKVYYSMPGLKVHAKTAQVRRKEGKRHKLYAYMSSGNFHEDTARLYSDFGLFTKHTQINHEIARLFKYLETKRRPTKNFEHLLVGFFNLMGELKNMIHNEINAAEKGKKAEMIIKANSLEDPEMVELLYKASQAGVSIKLIIRGICSLVPALPELSENIEVISIVDRYLEHARVFIFHNNGDTKMYLSSADWMRRNLRKRIETVFPIYDEKIKNSIMEILDIQLKDNVKARMIHPKKNNHYRKNNKEEQIQTQLKTYEYVSNMKEVRYKKKILT